MTLEILLTETEGHQLVRKKFAKLSRKGFNPSTLSVITKPDWRKYQHQINERFTPSTLAGLYVEVIQQFHQYFQDIAGHKWSSKVLLKELLRAKFAYASPKAYQCYCANPPASSNEKARYTHDSNEIIVSLPNDVTIKNIKVYNRHEFGHFMHYFDAPKSYLDSDPIMKEMLALLPEDQEVLSKYNFSGSPIGTAEALLRIANETKFEGKPFKEKWKILTEFQKHQDFVDYLNNKSLIFTSLT